MTWAQFFLGWIALSVVFCAGWAMAGLALKRKHGHHNQKE